MDGVADRLRPRGAIDEEIGDPALADAIAEPAAKFDPYTGKPIKPEFKFDPYTGKAITEEAASEKGA